MISRAFPPPAVNHADVVKTAVSFLELAEHLPGLAASASIAAIREEFPEAVRIHAERHAEQQRRRSPLFLPSRALLRA